MPIYYFIATDGPIVKFALVDAKTDRTVSVILR